MNNSTTSYVKDLFEIQAADIYINEKKYLMEFCKKLYDVGFYTEYNSYKEYRKFLIDYDIIELEH